MDAGKILGMVVKTITKTIMKLIKGGLKFIFNVKNWPYMLAAVIVIVLVVLGIRYFRKRRAKGAESPDAPEVADEQPKGMPKNTLINVWDIFFKRIPKEFRRSISLFQPFVVLGEAGVGKSVLIDTYTDWKGQSRQFYPSYTQDSQLQFYLGSKVVVQELPAPLLNDTSQATRAALLKLWTSLFRKKASRVVVVLNAGELAAENKAAMKKQAQIMRGKINLMTLAHKKPVQVAIALSHMDQIAGFREFFDFLHANDIPLHLPVGTLAELEKLPSCLEAYEKYLTLALTRLSADDYLKMAAFLKTAPRLFAALASYCKILQGPDPLSVAPNITTVYLTSDNEDDQMISNPFHSRLSLADVKKFNPLRRHQIAAAVILAIGLAWLGAGMFYKYRVWNDTLAKIDALKNGPSDNYDEDVHQLFVYSDAGLKKDNFAKILPDFFPGAETRINQRLLAYIRSRYLLPALQQLEDAEVTIETRAKTQYLLALLYSARNNQLGKRMAGPHRVDCSWMLNLPERLIADYIRHSPKAWEKRVDTERLNIAKSYISVSGGQKNWLLFFNELDRLLKKPFITINQLSALKQKAADLLEIIQAADRRDFSAEIIDLLNRETPLTIRTELVGTISGSWMKQSAIRDLIGYILGKEIDALETKTLRLGQFLEHAKAILTLQEKQQKVFSFYFAGKDYSFRVTDMERLMMSSRMALLIRHFITLNQHNSAMMFFHPDSVYSEITLNPSNDGYLFFTGKARVDGRYTRQAFNEEVKPVLDELAAFIDRLPMRHSESIRFSNFITQAVKGYAAGYVSAWRKFYKDFGVQATSLAALRYTLAQIQLPHSPFQDFLVTVNENVNLDLGEQKNPFLSPFASSMQAFDSIKRLMQEDNKTYPELEKYKLIIGQLQADIENAAPYVPDNGADPSTFLKARLSPLGRITVSIFRAEENSYLNLVNLWLRSTGVQQPFRRLFLDPVYSAYGIGNAEAAAVIESQWTALVASSINEMVDKFPFSMHAAEGVSSQWLESQIHKDGAFWTVFNQMIAPVCIHKNGKWAARSSAMGKIPLPDDMLHTVNLMADLTRSLWDDQGVPRKLTYTIKPGLLPEARLNAPVVVLSYLKCGKATVFGFNQQPAWQPLTSQWWHQQSAAIGVEYAQRGEAEKAYQTISVPNSEWSLHRLLCKAEASHREEHQWRFSNLAASDASAPVVFYIKPNPWEIFNDQTWQQYRSVQ